MKLTRHRWLEPRRAALRAFSLLELMLSISIMVVIVGALYGTFYQTQKALRSSVNQVDVLGSGRAAMDLLSRDLSQMAPTRLALGTNFAVFLTPLYTPAVQSLPGTGNLFRTNRLQEIYFFSRFGQDVSGTCYRVLYASSNGVGTLSRFTLTTNLAAFRQPVSLLSLLVEQQPATNFTAIVDGVVHFRVQAYDTFGQPMLWLTNYYDSNSVWLVPDANDRLSPPLWRETRCTFLSNALPACVEVELGILDPTALQQFQSLSGSPLARSFLSNHVGQVQLFRQRVPIAQSAAFYAKYR
jgi:type II secretory pathway pseudopilin PulG